MIKLEEFRKCEFVAGAASVEQIPRSPLPEVAFVGRSNVGKSSLINAIVGRKDSARVSKSPGRTQQINFFTLANKISLVDLPGYGYAAISKKTRKTWDELILTYLTQRTNLRVVFLLIDSRHGIKDNDEEVMEILDNFAVPYQIVLTKFDKAGSVETKSLVTKQIESQIALHAAAHPVFITTSSQKSLGIQEIRKEITKFT